MTARRPTKLVRDGWLWHLGQDGWFQVRPVNDDEVPPQIEASAADLQSAAAVGARAGVPRPPARGPVTLSGLAARPELVAGAPAARLPSLGVSSLDWPGPAGSRSPRSGPFPGG